MAELCDFSEMFLNAEIKPIPNLEENDAISNWNTRTPKERGGEK